MSSQLRQACRLQFVCAGTVRDVMGETILYILAGIAVVVIVLSIWGLIRSSRSKKRMDSPPDEIYPLW